MTHQITIEAIRKIDNDIKDQFRCGLAEADITQEQLGSTAGVTQSLICRQLEHNSDYHPPMYLGFVAPTLVASFPLNYILAHHGCFMGRRVPLVGAINGSLTEECLSLAEELGKIVERAKNLNIDPRAVRRELQKMRGFLDQADAEVEAKLNGVHS